jgi:hypothetical protein
MRITCSDIRKNSNNLKDAKKEPEIINVLLLKI